MCCLILSKPKFQVGRDFLIPTPSKQGSCRKRICAKGIPSGNPTGYMNLTGAELV